MLFFCRSVSRAGQGFMATLSDSDENKEDATGWTIEDNGKCDWFERKRKGNIHIQQRLLLKKYPLFTLLKILWTNTYKINYCLTDVSVCNLK